MHSLWGPHYFQKAEESFCVWQGVTEIRNSLMEGERNQATSDGGGNKNQFINSGQI